MPAAKEDFSCATCTKRHETGNPAGALECRALPPIQGLSRDAGFPIVRADYHCHVYFEADAVAVKARRASADSTATLDAKVAETRARADAAATKVAAAQPELALEAAEAVEPASQAAPPSRARRARGAKS